MNRFRGRNRRLFRDIEKAVQGRHSDFFAIGGDSIVRPARRNALSRAFWNGYHGLLMPNGNIPHVEGSPAYVAYRCGEHVRGENDFWADKEVV